MYAIALRAKNQRLSASGNPSETRRQGNVRCSGSSTKWRSELFRNSINKFRLYFDFLSNNGKVEETLEEDFVHI